ncbi:hypothetical protein TGRH88_032970 [Toxoplasma gondii]|uniref:Uncharacterized protein n=1 Tax=Toxoplasma gondii TaxID=5811 RepID=A0A7J6K794_TOXGO|nr:hypothetical protein TGRH88_032970 [Toxoplasma gondii]
MCVSSGGVEAKKTFRKKRKSSSSVLVQFLFSELLVRWGKPSFPARGRTSEISSFAHLQEMAAVSPFRLEQLV